MCRGGGGRAQKWEWRNLVQIKLGTNSKITVKKSIAFGSAPRREADSQPISHLARSAVSQTETHSLGFLPVADSAASSGEDPNSQSKQWPNGNAADRRLFGRRFEPRSGKDGGGADDDNRPTNQDSDCRLKSLQPAALPFNRGLM